MGHSTVGYMHSFLNRPQRVHYLLNGKSVCNIGIKGNKRLTSSVKKDVTCSVCLNMHRKSLLKAQYDNN